MVMRARNYIKLNFTGIKESGLIKGWMARSCPSLRSRRIKLPRSYNDNNHEDIDYRRNTYE